MSYTKCAYYNCTNTSRYSSMFRFPIRDNKRLLLWIRNSDVLSSPEVLKVKKATKFYSKQTVTGKSTPQICSRAHSSPTLLAAVEPEDKLLHKGYKCDPCLSLISGYRYTCVQCEDVDLCASCEASGAHAAHYVLRVPRPCPEEEVEELLKELRRLLKKRPPDRPVEKTITPSDCVPAAEDPLKDAPASPDVRSTDQSESDDETTESESDESYPEHPDDTDSLPVKTSRADLNPKDSQVSSKQNEIISPKRRKLGSYQKSTISDPLISMEQADKSINSDNSNENSGTDEASYESNGVTINLDNTLKENLNASALEAETVQKAKAQIKAEVELTEDNVGLEIANENNLRIDEDDNKIHLQEILDEEPLDFITHNENFNEDDPLATRVPSKASTSTYGYRC